MFPYVSIIKPLVIGPTNSPNSKTIMKTDVAIESSVILTLSPR